MINPLAKIATRLEGVSPELVSTKEKLAGMKKVKATRIYGKFGGTDRYSINHKSIEGDIKRLLMSLKETGVKDFYQFYKGNDLYISKPYEFEYVFYNAK